MVVELACNCGDILRENATASSAWGGLWNIQDQIVDRKGLLQATKGIKKEPVSL